MDAESKPHVWSQIIAAGSVPAARAGMNGYGTERTCCLCGVRQFVPIEDKSGKFFNPSFADMVALLPEKHCDCLTVRWGDYLDPWNPAIEAMLGNLARPQSAGSVLVALRLTPVLTRRSWLRRSFNMIGPEWFVGRAATPLGVAPEAGSHVITSYVYLRALLHTLDVTDENMLAELLRVS